MQTVRRHLLRRVGDILAFAFTIAVGLAMGGALSVGEAIEERILDKRATARHTQDRP